MPKNTKTAKSPSLKQQLSELELFTKSGSPAPKVQEKALSLARAWLTQQRQALKEHYLASGNAEKLLADKTAMVDTLLDALFAAAKGGKSPSIALVAVGGYGRKELFPYSDIDLLFLYKAGHDKEAAHVAEFILYLLWDLGLKVGQAHRTVDETLELANQDIATRSTLLDARFIVGRKAIFENLMERFREEIVKDSVVEFVEAKLAERDGRHQRFGDSRYMLEPNVKEGKGGLRDLHTLWWMARYAYEIDDLKELVGMKRLTAEEYESFDQARQFLWRVRIHLHYLAERAEDRLTFDKQYAMAVAMGFRHPSVNRSIERFMRRYFVAVRTVGSITRIFCALLEEEKKRKPRRSLAWLWLEPWVMGGFRLEGERLSVRSPHAFEHNPVMMIEMFKIAQEEDLDIHPRALQLMARHLKKIDDDVRRDSKANDLFLNILMSPKGPETTLRRMSEAGVLGRFIPDFGRVIGQTQFNMYHVYTVDEHTLVALGILHNTEKGLLREELPLATEIIHRVQMKRVLYLALFCHDIAKGKGGDHSELGEKIVTRLAMRFGFSRDEIETAAWLVRHHLLFSNTAFKRDINDPKAVSDFVRLVQTPERLKLLLVLTAADIRAVGPAVWNAWKGALLRELYTRAEQCMGTGSATLRQHETGLFRADLMKLLPGWTESDIDAYLELGNPNFWASLDLPHHALIAPLMKRMLSGPKEKSAPPMIDTRHDYYRSITEIILCSYDEYALFSKIAGAMSLAGANIINAKLFTLKNGLAIYVFQVQDGAGAVFDRPDRLAKMAVYIEQALSGEIDLAGAFAKRTTDYGKTSATLPPPSQVFIENNASNICSVIELTGPDRNGLLYDVTKTIAELGLTIATAHISTYGMQVADVFYVKDIFGMKLTHDAKLKQVRNTLLGIIEEGGENSDQASRAAISS